MQLVPRRAGGPRHQLHDHARERAQRRRRSSAEQGGEHRGCCRRQVFKRNIEAWPERTQALFDPEGDSPDAVYVSRIPTTYFPIRIFATESEALAWVRPGRIYLVRPEWLLNGVEALP